MLLTALLAAAALELIGTTDRPAVEYRAGERMVFTLALTGEGELANGHSLRWRRTGDDGKVEEGTAPFTRDSRVSVTTSIDRAGFVRLEAEVVDPAGRPFAFERPGNASYRTLRFDGGAGADVGKLVGLPEPKDFDAFWTARKRRLAEVQPTAREVELDSADPSVRIYRVSVDCAGPRPVTGHLTVPAKAGCYPAEIAFDGYNGNPRGHERAPTTGPKDRIRLHINAHGYDLGREDEYYEEFYRSIMSGGHTYAMDSDFQNRHWKTSYFLGMVFRVVRAAEYLCTRPEWNGRDFAAIGTSQGGLQAIWCAALDRRVSRLEVTVPWNCDIGGEAAGRLRGDWYVKGTPALGYFSASNFAKRIPATCRATIVRAGLGDYVCPPSGIAICYNNLKCPKSIVWEQGSTHPFTRPAAHETWKYESTGK